MLLLGLLIEVSVDLWVIKKQGDGIVLDFYGTRDWVIYDTGDAGFLVKIL